ncbi:hypothetical protein K437DRAFT_268188 [Tilletiaria anomala UBC 951]|uniref:Uncharacterized protein n=1 Tax=Tilletiaria anomala (strain ATCC 24038 / CBS 436.72 / UBC 951) TaxID=1037660 RepID=A0A066W0M8_TILAU|nr:uncharacterized protein K437DRAFT_268188 [Tilletiaria anomala UBC 951]KDN46103.1 hypothetical protein K437DRAFT_268188 [Tilletiaria anomala UBC 951]
MERELKAKRERVETLPFLVPSSVAISLLRAAAVQGFFDEEAPSVAFFPRVLYTLLRILPFRIFQRKFEEEIVKLEKITSFFAPIWIIDAIVKVKAKGSKGTAETTFVFEHSRMPAHAWKDIDLMPLTAINEDFLFATAARAGESEETARNHSHYELFDPDIHLKPKGIALASGAALELPFAVSPLHLPSLLKNASLQALTISVATPTLNQPVMKVPLPLTQGKKYAMVATFPKDLGEIEQDADGEKIRFDAASLEVEMMAAYPIQLPIHMAEWSYKDQDGEKQSFLIAMNAHDITGLQICRSDKTRKWLVSTVKAGPAQLKGVDFFPEPPFDVLKNENEQAAIDGEVKEGLKGNNGDDPGCTENQLKHIMLKKIIDMTGSLGLTGFNALLKASKLLESANWNSVKRLEREGWQNRVATMIKTQSDSAESVPTMAPNGSHIDWCSPHVQRYSHNSWPNRVYSRAVLRHLDQRRIMIGMEQSSGAGSEKFWIREETPVGKKTGAVMSVKQHLVKSLANRDSKMPIWLRKLKNKGG